MYQTLSLSPQKPNQTKPNKAESISNKCYKQVNVLNKQFPSISLIQMYLLVLFRCVLLERCQIQQAPQKTTVVFSHKDLLISAIKMSRDSLKEEGFEGYQHQH